MGKEGGRREGREREITIQIMWHAIHHHRHKILKRGRGNRGGWDGGGGGRKQYTFFSSVQCTTQFFFYVRVCVTKGSARKKEECSKQTISIVFLFVCWLFFLCVSSPPVRRCYATEWPFRPRPETQGRIIISHTLLVLGPYSFTDLDHELASKAG